MGLFALLGFFGLIALIAHIAHKKARRPFGQRAMQYL